MEYSMSHCRPSCQLPESVSCQQPRGN